MPFCDGEEKGLGWVNIGDLYNHSIMYRCCGNWMEERVDRKSLPRSVTKLR